MTFTTTQKKITFFIVLISFLIRVIRLDVPHDWSFDEVYHALSAEAYALNDPRGYEWWNPSPKDLAYEWLHPPLGKVFMAASIKIFAKPYIPESKQQPVSGATAFAWRFPGVIFAAITVWLLIRFGTKLFDNFWVGAAAGMLYALDGLSFVQSRTGMNDIYITCFVVFTFYRLFIFLKEYPKATAINLAWLGVATGLAASTKWTGFYAVAIAFLLCLFFVLRKRAAAVLLTPLIPFTIFLFTKAGEEPKIPITDHILSPLFFAGILLLMIGIFIFAKRQVRKVGFQIILFLSILPVLIYVASYGQWWVQKHTWEQFRELHRQIWWYQTGLTATHDYQSKAYTWPFLVRPVWFYVKYEDKIINGAKELYIGNIYTMGHPIIWWTGLGALGYILWLLIQNKIAERLLESKAMQKSEAKGALKALASELDVRHTGSFLIIVVGYFGMFAPWVLSPRIMFLYHYLPSIPFLCLALAYVLSRIRQQGKMAKLGVNLFLGSIVLIFLFFYPHWTAVLVPQKWVPFFYWLPTWK